MTMTVTIGILYTLLGLVIRMIYRPRPEFYSPTVARISTKFLMIGVLNILVLFLSLQIPAIKQYLTIITSLTVVLFGILIILETFETYRKLMDQHDKYYK